MHQSQADSIRIATPATEGARLCNIIGETLAADPGSIDPEAVTLALTLALGQAIASNDRLATNEDFAVELHNIEGRLARTIVSTRAASLRQIAA